MPITGSIKVRAKPSLQELLRLSLTLGAIGFGGGLSVLASLRSMIVVQRKWMTEREFNNTATVAQMLPGGAAANALAYVGLRFHGPLGAVAGYVGFIVPGMFFVLALAAAYVHFEMTPSAETALAGVNAAVVGIITSITLTMVRTSVARVWQMVVAALALLLSLVGGASSGELALVGIGVGLIMDLGVERARLLRYRRHRQKSVSPPVALPEEGQTLPRASILPPSNKTTTLRAHALPLAAIAVLALVGTGAATDLVRIGAVFLRTGLGAYGGGFAIIPHLQKTLHSEGWLTERQFADAVAIGKMTPGPVLLMATFIGYLLHGWSGALVATVAIFAAPLTLMLTLATWLDRVRSRRWVRSALRGLTPTVVGLMAAAGLTLGASLHGGAEVAIAASVALTLARFEVNAALLLLLAGAARMVLRGLTGA